MHRKKLYYFESRVSSSVNISPEINDQLLISRFKATGDLQVLATLYGRYMDLCYAVSIKYLKDADSAKDVVMEIFEELVDKLKKHEVTNFKSWLHTVVKNHCLMKLRADARNKPVNLDENVVQLNEEMHHDEIKEKEWQLQEMGKCIEGLVHDQKKAIELFYLQEKCYNEITELTGLDWNKVRSLIQNGRRNLKICMDKSVLSESGQ